MSQQTITTLYDAFRRLESEEMAACYSADATFRDPVFALDGRESITGMWRMLITSIRQNSPDVWRLDLTEVTDTSAHWEPHYRFSGSGRLVHNKIDAAFTFTPDGLIATHADKFNVWRWSRQAVGPLGLLLGWTPILPKMIRARAAANLEEFLAEGG